MFRTLNKDNQENSVIIQGAMSKSTSDDIASIVFQNYDDDTRERYSIAKIATRDHFGTATTNGIGDLLFLLKMPDVEAFQERVRFVHDGRVGVGTSSPLVGSLLDVAGSLSVRSNLVLGPPGNSLQLYVDATDGLLKSVGPSPSSNVTVYSSATSNVHVQSKNTLEFTSSASTPIAYMTYETPILPAGRYKININYQVTHNAIANCGIMVACTCDGEEWHQCTTYFQGRPGESACCCDVDVVDFTGSDQAHTIILVMTAVDEGFHVGLKKSRIELSATTQVP